MASFVRLPARASGAGAHRHASSVARKVGCYSESGLTGAFL
jgi:hypothetical protein